MPILTVEDDNIHSWGGEPHLAYRVVLYFKLGVFIYKSFLKIQYVTCTGTSTLHFLQTKRCVD